MLCKKCGHKNAMTASRCAACGENLGPNEMVEMFQKQSQTAKGVEINEQASSQGVVSSAAEFSGDLSGSFQGGFSAETISSEVPAEDFFGDLAKPSKPSIPARRLQHSSSAGKTGPEDSFFGDPTTSKSEEPMFETNIESLTTAEEEKPPEEHPLYSPPTNPTIEGYIARRASARVGSSK